MSAALGFDEIVRGLTAMGAPKEAAERAAAAEIAKRIVKESDAQPAVRTGPSKVTVTANGYDVPAAQLHRERDTLTLRYDLAPRTKKNSRRFLFKDSVAYKRFEDGIIAASASSIPELQLPMPRQPYNLCAVFYVDGPGKRADIFGLLQAIGDALQEAKVIQDDWDFRTCDGSRVVLDDAIPRVEVVITPIED